VLPDRTTRRAGVRSRAAVPPLTLSPSKDHLSLSKREGRLYASLRRPSSRRSVSPPNGSNQEATYHLRLPGNWRQNGSQQALRPPQRATTT
jgi:hypothetical protein